MRLVIGVCGRLGCSGVWMRLRLACTRGRGLPRCLLRLLLPLLLARDPASTVTVGLVCAPRRWVCSLLGAVGLLLLLLPVLWRMPVLLLLTIGQLLLLLVCLLMRSRLAVLLLLLLRPLLPLSMSTTADIC